MNTNLIDSMENTLSQSGIDARKGLLAMHMAEIAEELHNLTSLMGDLHLQAANQNSDDAQDTLVDITLSLEHLVHHAQYAIPEIEIQLDIRDENEATNPEFDKVLA